MSKHDDFLTRSNQFRSEYLAATPGWYRGEMQLAFTLLLTSAVMLYSYMQITNPTAGEWLLMIPMFLFGNWAEWAGHRYWLHRPTRLLKAVYKRHVTVHHLFFTHVTLKAEGQKSWRALLFPPFAPMMFILAAVPPALLVGWLWSANAGYIAMLTMAGYFVLYESVHVLSHIENNPFLDRLPLVNTARRMHAFHHNPEFMGTRNFNILFPICDVIFGTSDLKKSFWGTMFNGMADDAMKEEDRAKLQRQFHG